MNVYVIVNTREMIGRDYASDAAVTSSRRRGASAFGIDQLLELDRRDVIVTSSAPPMQSVAAASDVSCAAVPRRCLVDVDDWTDKSSDAFRARLGLHATSSSHSADSYESRSDQQHRAGTTSSIRNLYFTMRVK